MDVDVAERYKDAGHGGRLVDDRKKSALGQFNNEKDCRSCY